MREKLRIFPCGQYIIENVIFVAFWRHSQVQIKMGVVKKCTKMSTPFQMNFSA